MESKFNINDEVLIRDGLVMRPRRIIHIRDHYNKAIEPSYALDNKQIAFTSDITHLQNIIDEIDSYINLLSALEVVIFCPFSDIM